jgi:hypothetical protein
VRKRLCFLIGLSFIVLGSAAARTAFASTAPAVGVKPFHSSPSWMPDVAERVASLRDRLEQASEDARDRGRLDDQQRQWWRERVVELPAVEPR